MLLDDVIELTPGWLTKKLLQLIAIESLTFVLRRLVSVTALWAASCTLVIGGTSNLGGIYEATAYAQKGITASGQLAHPHVVAADPDILPIGSRIKIKHAGRYSGEYVVADTGEKIQGRKLDIYLPSAIACKRFGTKPVTVRIIQLGDGTHQAAKQADVAVKQDVKRDVAKNVVGNAATQADLHAKPTATSTASQIGTPKSTSTTKTDP